MVEIAGDQPTQATNEKAVIRKSTWLVHTILVLYPPITCNIGIMITDYYRVSL